MVKATDVLSRPPVPRSEATHAVADQDGSHAGELLELANGVFNRWGVVTDTAEGRLEIDGHIWNSVALQLRNPTIPDTAVAEEAVNEHNPAASWDDVKARRWIPPAAKGLAPAKDNGRVLHFAAPSRASFGPSRAQGTVVAIDTSLKQEFQGKGRWMDPKQQACTPHRPVPVDRARAVDATRADCCDES